VIVLLNLLINLLRTIKDPGNQKLGNSLFHTSKDYESDGNGTDIIKILNLPSDHHLSSIYLSGNMDDLAVTNKMNGEENPKDDNGWDPRVQG
jgi:hypothetical protein